MKKTIHMLALAALMTAAPALANDVRITATQEKLVYTTDAEGKRVANYVPAHEVAPGEIVRYSYVLANGGVEAADNIVINTQVPPEMIFVEDSASAENAIVLMAANNNGEFAQRDQVMVTAADGTLRLARADEITNLRFRLNGELAGGNSRLLRFSARLK